MCSSSLSYTLSYVLYFTHTQTSVYQIELTALSYIIHTSSICSSSTRYLHLSHFIIVISSIQITHIMIICSIKWWLVVNEPCLMIYTIVCYMCDGSVVMPFPRSMLLMYYYNRLLSYCVGSPPSSISWLAFDCCFCIIMIIIL